MKDAFPRAASTIPKGKFKQYVGQSGHGKQDVPKPKYPKSPVDNITQLIKPIEIPLNAA